MIGSLLVAAALGGQPCPLPVYLKSKKVRCADHPASTAFGRITWLENGRTVTMTVQKVDLQRTMAIHNKARRSGKGGFSLMGSGAGSAPRLGAPQTRPTAQGGPQDEADNLPLVGQQGQTGLTAEQRSDLRQRMATLQAERDVLWKQYKRLLAGGIAPSNTLSSAINSRERQIERIQEQLNSR